jgi:hypothetical protein
MLEHELSFPVIQGWATGFGGRRTFILRCRHAPKRRCLPYPELTPRDRQSSPMQAVHERPSCLSVSLRWLRPQNS